jgi:hypothetical protein
MRLMTRSITTAAAIYGLAVPAAHAQAPAHPSLTGTWVLDLGKSEASNGLPVSATWTMAQHGDTLIADRETATAEMGVVKAHVVVGIDGKPWKNTISQPGVGDVETSSILAWDNGVLVTTTSGNIGGTDFVQTDRWTFGADGKSLVSQRSVTVAGEEVQSATLAFTKKP